MIAVVEFVESNTSLGAFHCCTKQSKLKMIVWPSYRQELWPNLDTFCTRLTIGCVHFRKNKVNKKHLINVISVAHMQIRHPVVRKGGPYTTRTTRVLFASTYTAKQLKPIYYCLIITRL